MHENGRSTLHNAIDRLSSGSNKGRYGLSLVEAMQLLHDAVDELEALREQTVLRVCVRCRAIYSGNSDVLCTACGARGAPAWSVKEKALEARNEALQDQIDTLTTSLEVILDLGSCEDLVPKPSQNRG